MALTGPSIGAAIQAAGPDLLGPTFPLLAQAVGAAVQAWAVIPANLVMTGITVGTAGAGVVNGKISLIPNPPVFVLAMNTSGVLGVTSPRIGTAIAVGIATAFTASAQYSGISTGVATGTDTSAVSVANPITLGALLLTNFNAFFGGVGGPTSPLLASALANAIVTNVQTATGLGIVSGPASPTGATGVSVGTVF